MNILDTKIYKDGNRTIVVFNNTTPKTEEMIRNILGAAMGTDVQTERINNVIPMKTIPEPMPQIPQETMNATVPIQHIEIPDIDENKLFEQKGFAGYVEVYEYYISNSNTLAAERKAELLNFINMHAMMMKQTDPNAIEEGQLKNIVSLGLDSIFSKKLPQILKETTYESLVISPVRKNGRISGRQKSQVSMELRAHWKDLQKLSNKASIIQNLILKDARSRFSLLRNI